MSKPIRALESRRFSLSFSSRCRNAAILEAGGDEEETLLTYGIVDQLQPRLRVEPGTDPMAVGGQLLDLLDRLQSDGEVVVIAIDDLQWADRQSSRALLFALRRLRVDKVLTIVSTRVDASVDPGWSRFTGGDSRITRIRLSGLNASDLIELASALGLGALSQRGAARLVAHTEGNALYCRALLDEIGVAGLNASDEQLPAPRSFPVSFWLAWQPSHRIAQSSWRQPRCLACTRRQSIIASVAMVSDWKSAMDGAVDAGLLGVGPTASDLTFAHPFVSCGDLCRPKSHEPAARVARAGLPDKSAVVFDLPIS